MTLTYSYKGKTADSCLTRLKLSETKDTLLYIKPCPQLLDTIKINRLIN